MDRPQHQRAIEKDGQDGSAVHGQVAPMTVTTPTTTHDNALDRLFSPSPSPLHSETSADESNLPLSPFHDRRDYSTREFTEDSQVNNEVCIRVEWQANGGDHGEGRWEAVYANVNPRKMSLKTKIKNAAPSPGLLVKPGNYKAVIRKQTVLVHVRKKAVRNGSTGVDRDANDDEELPKESRNESRKRKKAENADENYHEEASDTQRKKVAKVTNEKTPDPIIFPSRKAKSGKSSLNSTLFKLSKKRHNGRQKK